MHNVADVGFAQSFFAAFQSPTVEFPFSKKDDRGSIENRLLSSLDKIFSQFHKRASHRADAVQRAFESSAPLVDNAVSITAGTFKLQISTLTTDHEGNATVQSLVVEASVFKLEAETPEGSLVVDLSGARASLSQTEIEDGRAVNHFSLTAEVSNFSLLAETNEGFIEARQASQTFTETRLALEAYRNGDGDDDDDDDNSLLAESNDTFIEARQAIQTLTETQLALKAYREGDGDSLLARLLEHA